MLTMKAYKKFGLFQDPFTGDVTKADDVYLTDETRFVAEFLYQTAKAGGMVALLGESGSGKTTIRRYAMDRIQSEGQKIKIITPRSIDKARLTTSAICGYFLHKNHAFVARLAACFRVSLREIHDTAPELVAASTSLKLRGAGNIDFRAVQFVRVNQTVATQTVNIQMRRMSFCKKIRQNSVARKRAYDKNSLVCVLF